MIFKIFCVWIVLYLVIIPQAKGEGLRKGETVGLRPILFRSEFASRGTIRGLRNNTLRPGFDYRGYPKFKPIIKRDLRYFETNLAQAKNYAQLLNREFRDYVIQHPDVFHPQTIADAVSGNALKNPMLKDGTKLQWHHGKDGYELVTVTEHGRVSHVGGNKVWGYKYAEAAAKIPNREFIYTAGRWGSFVALDILFSSISLASTGESRWQQYAVDIAASTSAGAVALSVESLLISVFPLLKGSTPLFVKGVAINLGGPASWIASGAYFLVKFAIMVGWEHYQIQAALEVERRCRESEKRARMKIVDVGAKKNTEWLKKLLAQY